MIGPDTFERTVAVWLRDDAARSFPDQLDAVLMRTVETRQRAWWSSPERWLRMDTTFAGRLAPPFRATWPIVATVLLLIALLGALLVVGSRSPRLAPYGPALPGLIAQEEGGDIVIVDPVTKRRTAVSSDTEWDYAPAFSPDGTRLAFARRPTQQSRYSTLMVANAHGSELRPVTEPILDIASGEWSGDSALIALTSLGDTFGDIEQHQLSVVDVRTGTTRQLDVGMSVESARWMPPLGQEIMFRGLRGLLPDAVYAIRPDGSGLRPLTPQDGLSGAAYQEPRLAPDGRLLAYHTWLADTNMRVQIRDLVSGRVRTIPNPDLDADLFVMDFSPDGRSLLMLRQARDGDPPDFGGVLQLVLVPVEASGEWIELGPAISFAAVNDRPEIAATFTVDGANVMMLERARLRTLPVDGRPGTVEPWTGINLPAMQRVLRADVAGPLPCPGGGGCQS